MQKTITLCDLHYAHDEEEVHAEGATTVITLDKRTIEIDLCAEDKERLSNMLDVYFKEGRRPARPVSGPREVVSAPPQQRKSPAAPGDHGVVEVLSDGRIRLPSGRISRTNLVPDTEGVYYCDEKGCPKSHAPNGFDRAQGLRMHLIRTHRRSGNVANTGPGNTSLLVTAQG